MKIEKSGRDTLKSYFVKNAVPTVGNYQELIDAALNQRDDGIAKLPGEPLSMQADGDEASLKKLVNLYRNFADPSPAWTLSLSPRVTAADPASARAGLAFSNGDGKTALFLEQGSANVGIGTLNPARPLHVEGNEVHSGGTGAGFSFADRGLAPGTPIVKMGPGSRWVWYAQDGLARLWTAGDQLTVSSKGDLQVGGALTVQKGLTVNGDVAMNGSNTGLAGNLSVGTTAAPLAGVRLQVLGGAIQPSPASSQGDINSGILFPPDIAGGGGDRAWIRYYSRFPGHASLPMREQLTLEIGCSNDGDDHIALMPSGCVGIGTLTPLGKLDVAGSIVAGNSDLYFTQTGHIHTGFGNTTGYAAIENASNYNALMLLGRNLGTPQACNRHVEVWDFLRVNGTFINASDASVKRDIEPLQYGLAEVRRLRPVSFNWKSIANPQKTIGLIAQEVQPVIGEVVYDNPVEEQSRLGIAYSNLIPVLINAIQELADQLDALRAAPAKS